MNFSFPRRNCRNNLLLRTRHFISSDRAHVSSLSIYLSISLSLSLRLVCPPLQKLQTSYLSVLALGVLVIIAFINHRSANIRSFRSIARSELFRGTCAFQDDRTKSKRGVRNYPYDTIENLRLFICRPKITEINHAILFIIYSFQHAREIISRM